MENIYKLPLIFKFFRTEKKINHGKPPVVFLTKNEKYQADIKKKYFIKPISKIIDFDELTKE